MATITDLRPFGRPSSGTASSKPSASSEPHKGLISYNRLLVGGELDRALAKAQFDWKRLERMHDRFSEVPADRDLFDRLTRHEINAWAVKEDKPPIAVG